MAGKAALLVFCVVILASACCGPGSEEQAAEGRDTLSITSRLAIGAEDFRAEDGFAAVASVCHAPDSSVLVLDPIYAIVKRFSSDGELIMEYGSKGEGPGELSWPWDMAVSDGGFLFVSDVRGVNVYSLETGEWLELDHSYTNPVLLRMHGNRDSTFTALYANVGHASDFPEREATYRLFSWTSLTDVCFWADTSLLEHNDSEFIRLCRTQPVTTTDLQGNVYISESTPTRLLIRKYSPEGELLFTVEDEYAAVEYTDSQRHREAENYELFMSQLGANIEYTPPECWDQVTDLGVDGGGRIWARVGGEEPPLYRIYNQEGLLIGYVRIESIPVQGQYLHVHVSPWGIAAFPVDPAVEHIQIFLLERPDWNSPSTRVSPMDA
jgi:hypothetical protein